MAGQTRSVGLERPFSQLVMVSVVTPIRFAASFW